VPFPPEIAHALLVALHAPRDIKWIRPRFTKQKLVVMCVRGVAIRLSGRSPAALTHGIGRGVVFGPEIELGVGEIVVPVSPFVAWWTEQVTCAAFGVILVLVDFALRSLRYWATLVNLDIR
jgi:hypothetical protein